MTGKLTNGKPALTAKKYPSCFYAEDAYDVTAPEDGLFRSQFLLRVSPLLTRRMYPSSCALIGPASPLDRARLCDGPKRATECDVQRACAWPAHDDRAYDRLRMRPSEYISLIEILLVLLTYL